MANPPQREVFVTEYLTKKPPLLLVEGSCGERKVGRGERKPFGHTRSKEKAEVIYFLVF